MLYLVGVIQYFLFILQCPILSLGESVGARTVLCEDSSPLSGRFVVEEIECEEEGREEGCWVRRLVYLSAPHLAQTEVLMKPGQLQCFCFLAPVIKINFLVKQPKEISEKSVKFSCEIVIDN